MRVMILIDSFGKLSGVLFVENLERVFVRYGRPELFYLEQLTRHDFLHNGA